MSNNIQSNDAVDNYRLGQIEKSFEKFTVRIEEKLDKISDQFATRNALENAIAERNTKMTEIDERIDSLENKKRTRDTITWVILACSLITNLFAVYELFIK